MGTNSIDAERGITDLEWEVIEVKKAMLECSERVVSLAISEKLDTIQRLQVCSLSKIDLLITELEPEDPALSAYKAKGLNII